MERLIIIILNRKTIFTEEFHDIGVGLVPKFISDQVAKAINASVLVAIPVIVKGEVIGALDFLFSGKTIEEIKKDELETLLIITNQITVALENASLYAQIDNALAQLKIFNDQLKEKYQFEKDMMGIMGHELRTPMTVARGLSELAIYKINNSEVLDKEYFRDKIKKIHDLILKESDLIQTMLSTSHIDNNKMNLQISTFNFSDLVDYAVLAFKGEAQIKNLELNYIKTDKPLLEMNSDQSRIQEIVNNLISNAIKYTNQGSVTVSYHDDGEFVYFSVKDTGIGIPQSEIKKSWSKFP